MGARWVHLLSPGHPQRGYSVDMLPPGFRVKIKKTGQAGIVVGHERIGGTVVYEVKIESDSQVVKLASSDIEPAKQDDYVTSE
jgi:hypothetical protein